MASTHVLRAVTEENIPAADRVTAIIDIGSNSVRLVVYRGLVRNPLLVFNEKVMCGLGRSVGQSGMLDQAAMQKTISTLKRFSMLCADMEAHDIHAVATAAVRAASNRSEFIAHIVQETGLNVNVVSGEEEGRLSALGVIAAIKNADGVVGDLGGGSLELVHIHNNTVNERASLPIGPLNLHGKPDDVQTSIVKKALASVDWLDACHGKPFYMVGGAWRALSHLHMHVTDHPVPIIHEYEMPVDAPDILMKVLKTLDKNQVKNIPNLGERRLSSLPLAALLLKHVGGRMKASALVASAYGLREGVLYNRLSAAARLEDPLIAACRAEAELEGRFPEHGELLMSWMNPLFDPEETPSDRRLRLAACLLADIAWRGHPDFRAERAVDAAVYGNFVGIDVRGRLMLGVALFVAYSNTLQGGFAELARRVLSKNDVQRAQLWGAALRLGQRLTGGTAKPLEDSRIAITGDELLLTIEAVHADLYGEVVERRLKSLADMLKLKPRFRTV